MALAHHDAAHGDKAERADAKFFCTQDRGNHNVASGFQPAIGPQLDTMPQAVERQHLIGFGQPHFPWCPCIFDAGLRACAGSANIARNKDDVGMRFCHTSCDGADARCAHQLDAHPRARIDLLQVVDQLGKVFDRVNVMVRRR